MALLKSRYPHSTILVHLFEDVLLEEYYPSKGPIGWCHPRQACLVRARLNGIELMERKSQTWGWGNNQVRCCGCGKYINFKRKQEARDAVPSQSGV
jgi:hypothetical protein